MAAPTPPPIPSPGTCVAQITLPNFPSPTAVSENLTYYLDATIVAGPISTGAGGDTLSSQIQALIDADATYIAYVLANPGFSITVIPAGAVSYDNDGLTVVIIKPTSLVATNARGTYSDTDDVTEPFTCAESPVTPRRNRRRYSAVPTYPQSICIARPCDCSANPTNIAPPQSWINQNGLVYTLTYFDNYKSCYTIRDKNELNIPKRPVVIVNPGIPGQT